MSYLWLNNVNIYRNINERETATLSLQFFR